MLKPNPDLVEHCCDSLAIDLDDVKGNVGDKLLQTAIDNAITMSRVNREQFLEVFKRIYVCDPTVYRDNARDDALDEKGSSYA